MTHFAELRAVWDELTAPGGRYETHVVKDGGVPRLAYKAAAATLRDLWIDAAMRFADRPCLVFGGERLTYGDAFRQSERIAAWMQAQGIGKGDRVAIAMRNYPEWMLIYWAGVLAGATICGFNAWWSTSEMAGVEAATKPKILFVDAERLERARSYREPGAAGILVVLRSAAAGEDLVSWSTVADHCGTPILPPLGADDAACIFYTSGTSGTPKAAVLTHQACVTNILNILFAAEVQGIATARATAMPLPAAAPPVALVTTPLFHVTANNCCAQVAAVLGGTIVLMYKWDAAEALALVEREGVTMISGTPVMHRELVLHSRFNDVDLSSLGAFSGGGASLPPDILARIEDSSLTARASSGYGMTEASGAIASIAGDFFAAKPTSCGRILPAFEYRVVGDDAQDVAPGERGELWVRGASVIAGYLDATGSAIDPLPGGWLHSGDIVTIDTDGFVHIVDRKKDMILRGGENIACVEVEAAIYELGEVAECAVFAIPDARLGEIVGAAVYPHEGAVLDPETVAAHCAGRIAAYKIPERIWILDMPIPRGASGKLLKRDLGRLLLED
ncbi:class I adenylate-forming enzyme family protein [Sphingopyxis lindanitolerans]|uniref:class I adenylate-forming enzyme family protein n=1 Tax=Sphingopyxis lindanitolerans TaxID=2054227 RepID=UPI001F5BFF48|nr:class I adenylate-forming enzyme family protein [Sphingopyxis lindanitolerans]